jgi:hypothetical protein
MKITIFEKATLPSAVFLSGKSGWCAGRENGQSVIESVGYMERKIKGSVYWTIYEDAHILHPIPCLISGWMTVT